MSASAITLIDVGARDGLQNQPKILPSAQKVALIERLAIAGVTRIEAASFVNPKLVPQMADADAVMAALRASAATRDKQPTYIGLALNRRGAERALAAGVGEVGFVIAVSDSFNRKNQGCPTAETLAAWPEIAALCLEAKTPATITISTVFGCPFEGEMPLERVVELVTAIARTGAHEIALADTIGVADPTRVKSVIQAVRAAAPANPLRVHFHNTRGTGIANAYAAWESGVTVFDASVGGLGGCPFAPNATGNIASEELLYMFARMGVSTGIDLAAMIETARWLSGALETPLPSLVARAGCFPQA